MHFKSGAFSGTEIYLSKHHDTQRISQYTDTCSNKSGTQYLPWYHSLSYSLNYVQPNNINIFLTSEPLPLYYNNLKVHLNEVLKSRSIKPMVYSANIVPSLCSVISLFCSFYYLMPYFTSLPTAQTI